MRKFDCLLLITLMAGSTAASAQGGLSVPTDQAPWPRWQARIGVASLSTLDPLLGHRLNGAHLLGDYYFYRPTLGQGRVTGGFRTTSGVLLGSRAVAWGALGAETASSPRSESASGWDPGDSLQQTPYVGIGYTGLSVNGGWGFSADVGMMAYTEGGLRVGRVLMGMQSLDDAVRNLRLTPMLQLGVSYSF